ncbi:Ankyrin-2 [Durusdinium trenchii]|uniref:Ankyrin-2 n=1 Tax=Durusdinium trenchii TaxID=1381693 RepID=A0ABP0JGS0_9DINO
MLTIKYPAFQGLPEEERHAMYEQKKKRRAQFVEELFDHYDVSKTGYLCKDELQNALKEIGLAFDDGSVQGMLQRRGRKEKPDDALTIQRSEFPDVVREAGDAGTGRREDEDKDGVRNRLRRIGQEPLHGDRALMFLGKTSPAGWALRVRNLCPYALRGCQILQNVCNNPEFNPEYMEAWMDYHGGPVRDVEGVAAAAAAVAPTAEGGLCVRLDAVDPPGERPRRRGFGGGRMESGSFSDGW